MSLDTDYDQLCPLFNWNTKSGGVLFPFIPTFPGTPGDIWVDLDGADTSSILARAAFPMKVRLITCEADAVSDGQGLKAGAASTEPVLGIVYGTKPLASAGAGTSIGVLTCSGSGGAGDRWTGTTTPTTILTTQEVAVYLKQAGSSGTSGNQDGGARPILWFGIVNAP